MIRDLIVVGGGASGLACAVAAAEAGASVTVLEANPRPGGNGLFPMGIYGVDSPVQKRMLVYATAEEAFRSCMEYSHWKLDARLVRTIIERTGDTIRWLEELGVPFERVMHHTPNQNPEVFHIVAPGQSTGAAVMKALQKRAEALGVEIRTSTRAGRLIKDENGRVCGVAAETKAEEQIFSGKSVVLAAGGFGGNEELIARFFPKYKPENYLHMHGIRHRGEGLLMAMEAGADIEGNFAMEMGAPKIVGHQDLALLLSKPFAVWLNLDGERFTNESNVFNFTDCANACSRERDGVVFVLLSRRLKELVLQVGRDPLERITVPQGAEERLPQAIEEAVSDGLMCVSESLSDVAAFIGVTEEKLRATLEEYNADCARGYDRWFAKNRADLIPVEEGPYYIIRAGVDMIATHGGVRVNTSFNALDGERRPIPGLYIAGTDVGGLDADVYNMTMSGHAFGFAVNTGRLAGEAAAKYARSL